MPKYKKGDKVRVKSTLKLNSTYYMETSLIVGDVATNDMVALAGTIVTITDVCHKYTIEEDYEQRYWTDEMFEPITKVQWRL